MHGTITYDKLKYVITVNPPEITLMAFGSKQQYHNRLPLWMQTLLETNSVDAWNEDPDAPSSLQCSSGNKGNL